MEIIIVGGLVILTVILASHETNKPSRPEKRVPRKVPQAHPQVELGTERSPRSHPHSNLVAAARGSRLSGRAWVIDGDTIAIGRTKIRLAGIDAPELDMPFGQKSKWAMVGLCRGQRVTAVMHGETSYDRQVATVYLEDGRDAGAELVRQGLALDLAFFSGGKYRALEPDGARKRLANGNFGHRSLRRAHTRV